MSIPAPQITKAPRLTDDIRKEAATLDKLSAKRLVLAYWRAKDARIGNDLSTRDIDHPLVDFFSSSFERVQQQIRRSLLIYVDQNIPSRWAIAIPGVGPIISASLYAFIDIEKCGANVSKLWRYAGMDPTAQWATKGEVDPAIAMIRYQLGDDITPEHITKLCKMFNKNPKVVTRLAKSYNKGELSWNALSGALVTRPYNPELKQICYYLGLGIRRRNAIENNLYGQLYNQRKDYEYEINAQLGYEDQALEIYRKFNWKDTSPDSLAYVYKTGKLPPKHIEGRARRWTVKLFLSHFHEVLYYDTYGKRPDHPYILNATNGKGRIECPLWPFK